MDILPFFSLVVVRCRGDVIPTVEYSPEEVATWGLIYRQLKELQPTHTCRAHQEVFELLEKQGLYSDKFVPQLEDVSRFMKSKQTWPQVTNKKHSNQSINQSNWLNSDKFMQSSNTLTQLETLGMEINIFM